MHTSFSFSEVTVLSICPVTYWKPSGKLGHIGNWVGGPEHSAKRPLSCGKTHTLTRLLLSIDIAREQDSGVLCIEANMVHAMGVTVTPIHSLDFQTWESSGSVEVLSVGLSPTQRTMEVACTLAGTCMCCLQLAGSISLLGLRESKSGSSPLFWERSHSKDGWKAFSLASQQLRGRVELSPPHRADCWCACTHQWSLQWEGHFNAHAPSTAHEPRGIMTSWCAMGYRAPSICFTEILYSQFPIHSFWVVRIFYYL